MTKPTDLRPTSALDAAETLKGRLREDLKRAIRARALLDVRVLRALIAAVDNAQAVPIGDAHQRYFVHAFGDASTEVPRLSLDAGQVDALLADERSSRLLAADQFEQLGRVDRADGLRAEAAIVARFSPRST